jgi:twitching motility protein PilT
MVNHINESRFEHIVTIEDPIEFIHVHKNSVINQRELGQDTDSFPRALKSVLRQDPDVVLIGEMRDQETIAAALTVAETGHLVFATLHTNSSISTLNRIIDVFPPHQQAQVRTQLAMSLEGVLSQVLLPASGGGRVQALEVMRVNAPIRSLITEGKFHQIYSAMQMGQEESGMQTLNQSLLKLVEKRYIDQETALQKSPNPEELQEMLIRNLMTKDHDSRGRRPS